MSKKLPDQLKALQAEVNHVTLSDTQGHARKDEVLDELRGQIEKVLNEPEGEHHHTLIERLEDAVLLFGSDHPDLAEMINTTLTILANTGV